MQLDKKDSSRLERFCSGLPAKKLQKLAKSWEAQQVWLQLNDNATLLGKCLAVRAKRVGGDPIRSLLNGDEADRWKHSMLWAVTKKYETLFDLIQLCWQPIKDVMDCLESAPCSELALFLEVIEEFFNCTFSTCIDGGEYKPRDAEKFFLLHQKVTGRHPGRHSNNQEIKETEFLELAEFVNLSSKQTGSDKGVFYPILLRIFVEESRSNEAVKNTLHSYINQETAISDLMHKRYISARKEAALLSEQWLPEGKVLTGTRGGRYVTKAS